MKLHLAFASATALGLVMASGAFANENEAYLLQDGTNNSASVTQNSSATTGNQAGTSTDAVNQTGSDNVLVILQNGDNGQIGVKTGTDEYHTPPSYGIQYILNYQGVNQTSSGAGSNTASLTQNGNGSVIGQLQQTSTGKALGNSATVTQTGANTINHIFQTQNSADVGNAVNATQSGSGNVIDRIDQKGSGGGANNTINVNIGGSNNGTMDLGGTAPFYSSRAWVSGATQSALIQNNYGNLNGVILPATVSGNSINLTINGSDNQYGMTQKGSDNATGTVTINGSSNTFGSYQAGQGNLIGAGNIDGSSNDVGVWQIGSTNTATVSVLAFGSDSNELSIAQQGIDNDATVNITGNNNGGGALGGVAGTLAAANPASLFRGTIVQGSSLASQDNNATLTIVGNNNAFAIASLGSDNTVTGNIGSGGGSNNNSAAVLQSGNNNTASFSQAGAGSNSVAISQ
jgi:hypothetical protein